MLGLLVMPASMPNQKTSIYIYCGQHKEIKEIRCGQVIALNQSRFLNINK